MSSHPPVLTSERIDAALSSMAEVGMVALQKVGARLEAAETDEAVERLGRTLQGVGRYLRQTIAMKQRFDRGQLGLTAERRVQAKADRQQAEADHTDAISNHRLHVRNHFESALWNEYEDDDAQEIFNDLDERLEELSEDDAFLDIPIETLIARLVAEFEIPAQGQGPRHMAPRAKRPPPKPSQSWRSSSG